MSTIRERIDFELTRTRLDKGRLYNLLTKIVENCSGGLTMLLSRRPRLPLHP